MSLYSGPSHPLQVQEVWWNRVSSSAAPVLTLRMRDREKTQRKPWLTLAFQFQHGTQTIMTISAALHSQPNIQRPEINAQSWHFCQKPTLKKYELIQQLFPAANIPLFPLNFLNHFNACFPWGLHNLVNEIAWNGGIKLIEEHNRLGLWHPLSNHGRASAFLGNWWWCSYLLARTKQHTNQDEACDNHFSPGMVY